MGWGFWLEIMKHQIIIIHGGDNFDTYEEYIKFLKDWKINFEDYRNPRSGWKSSLSKKLGKNFEIIKPNMPNEINAKYPEWKIWFEKFVPYFEDEVILIGHSLGGVFLAKYLAENILPRKILATFLVAAPFDDKDAEYSLADFALPSNLSKFQKQGGRIFLYHSQDDPVVPFVDLAKYQKSLINVSARIFKDRGHFLQEQFPEIVRDIKSVYK